MGPINRDVNNPEQLLEQWAKCVDMANSNSDKRISSNNTFLTIEAALLAVISFTGDWKNILLSLIGIIVSIFWLISISSYKALNAVKYEIINELEQSLSALPFTEEWERLQKRKKYSLLTTTEKMLPIVFIVLFSVVILIAIGELILPLLCTCVTGGTTP